MTGSWRGRRRLVGGLAFAVFVFAFLYRFNALGGSLAGFDGDHFIYYLAAKQVAHGERPLRDFADAGLQGAWPALTYELPALAQTWGGETLLSEAVFAVGTIALSLTLIFLTAAQLAGPMPALMVTLATLFVGTKLYGYSKLVVFAVAAALLVRYARQPTAARAGLLAVWSAVAFLFRHDFLVYLVPAATLLIVALGSPPWRQTLKRLLEYGGVTILLLLAPLYSIERYVGWTSYVRTNMALTEHEAQRTNLRWPQFVATQGGFRDFFGEEQNAAAWLYYVCLAVPALALIGLLRTPALPGLDARHARALIVSLVLLAVLLNSYFLRGNLPGRFGDLGAPIAILAAWLTTTHRGASLPARALAWTATAAVLIVTVLAISTIGSVWNELDTTGFRDSFKKIGRRIGAVTTELGALPPPPSGDVPASASNVAEYVRACTGPRDRVLVVADAPEILTFAARAFAAGQPTFRPGFFTLREDQQLMLRRLQNQWVPVVLTDQEGAYRENFAAAFPLIHQYIVTFYEPVGELPALAGPPIRVLVRRGRTTTTQYGATGLPCFQ